MDMLVEDAGLCTRTSQMTQASSILQFRDQGPAGKAMLYDILYRITVDRSSGSPEPERIDG